MEYWISRKNFLNKVFKEIITVFLTDVSIFFKFSHQNRLFSKNKQTNKLTDSIYSETRGEVIPMDAKLQVDRIFLKRSNTCMAPLSVRGREATRFLT